MATAVAKVGRRGTVVIPAELRSRYGLKEGSHVVVEERPEGVLLRPVVTLPVEIYSSERKAEFLLNNAVSEADYEWALRAVREMGINPETIPHERPKSS
jgi:AbrB family looped-hinge helix DNA binding protein